MNEAQKNIFDWPISPCFLSIREGVNKYDISNTVSYSPNKDGLFYADELRGFLADASDDPDINNILALLQVIPSNFEYETRGNRIEEFKPKNKFISNILADRKIIRIDPGKLFSNIRCCELFRQCKDMAGEENASKCFELDSRIALLYHNDISKINYKSEPDLFYNTLKRIIGDYNKEIEFEEPYFPLKIVRYKENTRLYVQYQCKYSRLVEFFFPIIHAGKVIAVLMQGQRFPSGLTKKGMFSEYRNRKGDDAKKRLDNFIKKMEKTYFSSTNEPLNNTRLNAITKRIELLEDRVNDAVNAMSQKYVSTQFQSIESNFRREIKTNKINDFDSYKKVLDKTLQEIFQRFNPLDKDGFIRIYTIKSPIVTDNASSDEFNIIGDSTLNDDTSKYSPLLFRKIKNKDKTIEKEELLTYLKQKPKDLNVNEDVFRMDVPFTSQIVYIIWKKYNTRKKEHEDQYMIYASSLKLIYHTLLEPYIILYGAKLEEKLEASMRISAHESVQIIPSIIQTINNKDSLETLDNGKAYIGDGNILKPAYKIIDVSFRLLLLEGLFNRSSLIFKDKPPIYKYFDFHRIVFATESLFQDKSYLDNKQKIIPKHNEELSKYYLKTDYGYLSHVLFNLMDNAIKHSLRGSNIYIKTDLQYIGILEDILNKKTIEKVLISVVSFGRRIENSEREQMFDLYYRSPNVEKKEGMGIGLFLVKKLCNILGYKIECKSSEKIGDYHLPIKYHYCIQNPQFGNDSSLRPDILQILKKEIKKEHLETINTKKMMDDWEITAEELNSMLFEPIYQNEFQITIPIKENDLKPINDHGKNITD